MTVYIIMSIHSWVILIYSALLHAYIYTSITINLIHHTIDYAGPLVIVCNCAFFQMFVIDPRVRNMLLHAICVLPFETVLFNFNHATWILTCERMHQFGDLPLNNPLGRSSCPFTKKLLTQQKQVSLSTHHG